MSSEAKKRNEGGGPGSQVLADCETFFAPKNCPPGKSTNRCPAFFFAKIFRFII
jgi:hypothetical protein